MAAGAFFGPVVKHGLNFSAWSHMSGLLLVVVAVLSWFPLALSSKPNEENQEPASAEP